MSNVQTVQEIYEAFGRGDVPGLLARLSDDVIWEPDSIDHRVAWLKPGRGKDHVSGFFATVGAELEIERFQPLNILEGGDQVAAVIDVAGRVRATGKSITGTEVHLWTFGEDGLAVALRHFVDTHAHVLAAR